MPDPGAQRAHGRHVREGAALLPLSERLLQGACAWVPALRRARQRHSPRRSAEPSGGEEGLRCAAPRRAPLQPKRLPVVPVTTERFKGARIAAGLRRPMIPLARVGGEVRPRGGSLYSALPSTGWFQSQRSFLGNRAVRGAAQHPSGDNAAATALPRRRSDLRPARTPANDRTRARGPTRRLVVEGGARGGASHHGKRRRTQRPPRRLSATPPRPGALNLKAAKRATPPPFPGVPCFHPSARRCT